MKSLSKSYECIISKPYQVMLIVAIVLGIYYPTIFSEISLLDDLDMVNNLFNMEKPDIWGLFFPKSHQGGYYRPLIGVSHLIDNFAWGLESKIMHFENILLHLVNALLVFWLASLLIKPRNGCNRYLPLVASLLFSLNPIVTESVNWISGRTDVLAGMFILLSAVCVVRFRDERSYIYLVGASSLIFTGLLAKETALGFIPGALILLVSKDIPNSELDADKLFFNLKELICYLAFTSIAIISTIFFYNYWLVLGIGMAYLAMLNHEYLTTHPPRQIFLENFRKILIFIAAVVLCAGIYLLLRKIAYSSDISKIGQTIKLMFQDLNYTLIVFSGAAGFYFKKFFIPLPLNLAIREIDPLYELLGIMLFFFCINLVHRRRLYGGLFLTGCCLLVPALPFAFGTIAWTAYAERYVYLASPFWILALCVYYSHINNHITSIKFTRFRAGMVCILIILAAVSTFGRNKVWQKNVTIFEDTVEQSPRFRQVRGLYMASLMGENKYDQAIQQYNIANSLNFIEYEEHYDLLYASILNGQKRYDDAEAVYEIVIKKSQGKKAIAYKSMLSFLTAKKQRVKDPELLKKLNTRMIDCHEHIYKLEPTLHNLYVLGQMYIANGDKRKALASFNSVISDKSTDAKMRTNAAKLVNSLRLEISE